MYSSVGRHCNLYDLSDEEAGVIGGNMDRMFTMPLDRMFSSDREYMKQTKFSTASWRNPRTGRYDTKAYWSYTDMSRISKEDLATLKSFLEKDRKFATFLHDGLKAMKQDKSLSKESFTNVNSPGEYTLDSAIQSYSTAVKQAE